MAFRKDARHTWLIQRDWIWQGAIYGGMIVASLVSLIYTFTQ
jgi:hypothetical protein